MMLNPQSRTTKIILTVAFALMLLVGLFAPLMSYAADRFSVVEIANFSCPHCKEMDAAHAAIAAAARQAGGRFVFAPLSWDDQSPARDLVYYAARDQGSSLEQAVRASLFRGTQEYGQPFEDIPQVLVWLQQDLAANITIDWTKLQTDAVGPAAKDAFARAVNLSKVAGLTAVPSFVFVKDGAVVATLTADSDHPSPADLKRAVIQKIQALSSNK